MQSPEDRNGMVGRLRPEIYLRLDKISYFIDPLH